MDWYNIAARCLTLWLILWLIRDYLIDKGCKAEKERQIEEQIKEFYKNTRKKN